MQSIYNNCILHFNQGIEGGFDLIIGADGAWSKVRTSPSKEQSIYCSIASFNMLISNAMEDIPGAYSLS